MYVNGIITFCITTRKSIFRTENGWENDYVRSDSIIRSRYRYLFNSNACNAYFRCTYTGAYANIVIPNKLFRAVFDQVIR